MLAKVIKRVGESKGFSPVMNYVMRASEEESGKVAPGGRFEAGALNLDSYWDPATDLTDAHERAGFARDLAMQCEAIEDACRARPASRFTGNPVYHVAINWREGEHPTRGEAERACRHVMAALGCAGHQAAWAIHRDTDHDHVHLVVNRVHPERHTVWSVPRRDYFILDKCMRELEIEFGRGRANGPWITRDTEHGPEIVRMSRVERRARGLLKDDGGPRLTDPATRAEKHSGADSFQRWMAGPQGPAQELRTVIERPDATWQDVHAALARYGVRIERKGSGMVVTSTIDDGRGGERVLAAKASQLGRWASKAALEKRLGPFESPKPDRPLPAPDPERTYAVALEEAIMDVDRDQPRMGSADGTVTESAAEESPGVEHDDDVADERQQHDREDADRRSGQRGDPRGRDRRDQSRRDERKAERQRARESLRAAFRAEQTATRARRRAERSALTARHQAERKTLYTKLRGERTEVRRAARQARQDPVAALSLWAKRAAEQKEELQRRQADERAALRLPPPATVWRKWLEQRAAAGDPAAEAALRGVRYRERRRKGCDAFEGADHSTLEPRFTVAMLTADIDRRHRFVTYRGADGIEKFVDFGQRIEMHDHAADTLEAALRIAAEKYAGRVSIQGSGEFRERGARLAARIGVRVTDEDLRSIVTNERNRIEEEWRRPVPPPREALERPAQEPPQAPAPLPPEVEIDDEQDLGR